ncbi:MAG: hypothetical protein WBG92_12785 [Thiohalocapsa sp.]
MTQIRIKNDPPPSLSPVSYHGRKQQTQPLTHHEILALIAPFTRRGRHADLAASDRAERKLAFKPIDHASTGDDEPALRETMALEVEGRDRFRLVRTVAIADGIGAGLASTLTADGADLAAMLDRVESVPVRRQVAVYAGIPLVRGYYVDADAPASEAGAFPGPVFVDAKSRIDGMNLACQADRRRGMPVEVKLTAAPGQELRLPEDLIAVLGWRYRPLVHIISYWRGTIDVARREPERTPEIEYRLGQTVKHLARTLSESPESYHERYLRARWRVTFQRAIPLLIGLSLLAATPLVRFLDMEGNSILRMLIFHSPPLLLVSFFLMREMPRLEIPPFPRQLHYPAWILPSTDKGARSSATDPDKAQESSARPLEAKT